MKLAFLCSDDISNQLLIKTCKNLNIEVIVCIEKNTDNKKIIKKKFNKLNFIEKFIFPIDILSILIYKKIIEKYLNNNLNLINNYFVKENFLFTKDINSPKVYKKLMNFKPDLILVRGTSIIKYPLIKFDTKYFLNLHGAIVPNYRNVNGIFWSFFFRDFSNMGSSILHITEGIDNGNIALMSNLQDRPSSLRDYHLKTSF